ncbi:MAG: hypothetical protein E2O77_14400 [Caldithrix sp.]|nr:MAG: hypothetical protein E2O77_14400 [Caldithrix sp.]
MSSSPGTAQPHVFKYLLCRGPNHGILSEVIDASLSYTELHFYCCVNDTEGKMTNNRQGHSLGVVCRILAKNAKVRSNGIKRGLSNEFRDEK